jgi:hypothetical protein
MSTISRVLLLDEEEEVDTFLRKDGHFFFARRIWFLRLREQPL